MQAKCEVRSEKGEGETFGTGAGKTIQVIPRQPKLLVWRPPVADRGISMEVQGKILGIMSLALTIPKAIADVFVSYSPHVELLHVTVHRAGYKTDGSPDVVFSLWDLKPSSLKEALDFLRDLSEGKEVFSRS